MILSSSTALFKLGPVLILPMLDGRLIALGRPTHGLLPRDSRIPQDPADVSRMVANPKLPQDQLRYPPAVPYLARETKVLGLVSSQKLGQLRPLLVGESGACPAGNPAFQSFNAAFAAPSHTLAYCACGHSQNIGYLLLGEALVLQFPGPDPAAFAPVGSVF